MFVTKRIAKSTEVQKLTVTKVLQRDDGKIKRHVASSQQRHKKRVQPQLWKVKGSSIAVNSSTSCENPISFNRTDFLSLQYQMPKSFLHGDLLQSVARNSHRVQV